MSILIANTNKYLRIIPDPRHKCREKSIDCQSNCQRFQLLGTDSSFDFSEQKTADMTWNTGDYAVCSTAIEMNDEQHAELSPVGSIESLI